jgi:hypothetical protein
MHQRSSIRSQFDDPLPHDLFQQLFPARLQQHQNLPAVFSSARPSHITSRFHAIYQFHGAVVAQRQSLRQSAYGSRLPFGQPASSQQQQILLRLQPNLARRVIAFLQESPDAVAQFGQRAILLF